jgi:transcriptional regulator with XRE-family HTH domain
MSLFSDNIRHLRVKKEVSQSIVAQDLSISRDRLAKYEEGKSQPPFEILLKLSHYYHMSIDLMLSVDIRKIDVGALLKLDDNRLLLPIVVDANGENVIEIVPHKAKAGYLTGFSDPEYIENLQHISLPMLKGGKFRAFEIDGDSMPPYKDGSFIVGKYIENIQDLIAERSYLVMSNEGMTYKRLLEAGADYLLLESDNEFYEPFRVPLSEILQIWEFAGYFGTRELRVKKTGRETTRDVVLGLRREFREYVKLNTKHK